MQELLKVQLHSARKILLANDESQIPTTNLGVYFSFKAEYSESLDEIVYL